MRELVASSEGRWTVLCGMPAVPAWAALRRADRGSSGVGAILTEFRWASSTLILPISFGRETETAASGSSDFTRVQDRLGAVGRVFNAQIIEIESRRGQRGALEPTKMHWPCRETDPVIWLKIVHADEGARRTQARGPRKTPVPATTCQSYTDLRAVCHRLSRFWLRRT